MAGIAVYCFQHTNPAYVYIAALTAVYALGLMPLYRAAWLRSAAMTLFSLALLVGIVEYNYYCNFKRYLKPSFEAEHAQHVTPDPILGYALNTAMDKYRCTMHKGEQLVYDIEYTRGNRSWRVTPEAPDATQGIFFFGCSFTRGEGVGDTENLPYKVGEALGPDFQVYNFGMHGYGPHQFLAELESGRKAELFKKYDKIQIIFLNIIEHEFRSAGFAEWDTDGPRYVLEQGTLVRRGIFSEKDFWQSAVDTALDTSYVWKRINKSGKLPNQSRIMALQTAILLKARSLVLEQYPHATFTILTYPDAEKEAALLRQQGVETVYLGDFLPDWSTDKESYKIPFDGHPNPTAYTRISQGLVPLLRGTK